MRGYFGLKLQIAQNCRTYVLDFVMQKSRVNCEKGYSGEHCHGLVYRKIMPHFRSLSDMLFITVKKEGQNGIISSIAFSPDHSGMYALGSYSKSGLSLSLNWQTEFTIKKLFITNGRCGGLLVGALDSRLRSLGSLTKLGSLWHDLS